MTDDQTYDANLHAMEDGWKNQDLWRIGTAAICSAAFEAMRPRLKGAEKREDAWDRLGDDSPFAAIVNAVVESAVSDAYMRGVSFGMQSTMRGRRK